MPEYRNDLRRSYSFSPRTMAARPVVIVDQYWAVESKELPRIYVTTHRVPQGDPAPPPPVRVNRQRGVRSWPPNAARIPIASVTTTTSVVPENHGLSPKTNALSSVSNFVCVIYRFILG